MKLIILINIILFSIIEYACSSSQTYYKLQYEYVSLKKYNLVRELSLINGSNNGEKYAQGKNEFLVPLTSFRIERNSQLPIKNLLCLIETGISAQINPAKNSYNIISTPQNYSGTISMPWTYNRNMPVPFEPESLSNARTLLEEKTSIYYIPFSLGVGYEIFLGKKTSTLLKFKGMVNYFNTTTERIRQITYVNDQLPIQAGDIISEKYEYSYSGLNSGIGINVGTVYKFTDKLELLFEIGYVNTKEITFITEKQPNIGENTSIKEGQEIGGVGYGFGIGINYSF